MKWTALALFTTALLFSAPVAAFPPAPNVALSPPTVAETTVTTKVVDEGVDLAKVLPNYLTYGSTPPALPVRGNASLVYDPLLKEMVLFGGIGAGGTALGDTWVLPDPVNGVFAPWVMVSASAAAPNAREGAAMAWDPFDGGVVLFGGVNPVTSAYDGDMWLFNGSGWHPILFGAGPGPRAFAALSFDPVDSVMVLWGGATVSGGKLFDLNDTWHFPSGSINSGTFAWTFFKPTKVTGPSPEPRQRAAMAPEGSGDGVLLGGGLTASSFSYSGWWTWSASMDWAKYTSPVPPDDPFATIASSTGFDLYYYGNNSAGVPGAWTFTVAGGFAQVFPAPHPVPRHAASFAAGAVGVYLFGGFNATTLFNDTDILHVPVSWVLNPVNVLSLPGGVISPCASSTSIPSITLAFFPRSGYLSLSTSGICSLRLDLTDLFWNWANVTPAVCPPVGISICIPSLSDNFTLGYEDWLGQLSLLSFGSSPSLLNLTIGPISTYLSNVIGIPSTASGGAFVGTAPPPGGNLTYTLLPTIANRTINVSFSGGYWRLGNNTDAVLSPAQDLWGMGQVAWYGAVNTTPPGPSPLPPPSSPVLVLIIAVAAAGGVGAFLAYEYRKTDRSGEGFVRWLRGLRK